MHRAAILAIVGGIAIGIVGGLSAGSVWLGVGVAIVTVGVTAVWGLAIWKYPCDALKVVAEVESMASGYPTSVGAPDGTCEIGSQIVNERTLVPRAQTQRAE